MAGIDTRYYYLTLGLLILCAMIGIILAYSFQREVNEDLAPPTEKDLLGPLEKAYYSGLMNEAEFHRIKASMVRKMQPVPKKKSKPHPRLIEAADDPEFQGGPAPEKPEGSEPEE